MAGESKSTTDHETIRRWVEERNGKPSAVKATKEESETGILRIDFPGYSGKDTLEEISWDEFFNKFDKANLAFLYQDRLSSGEESRFFKFVDRNNQSKQKK
jgi:hypothetical protein